MSKKLYRSKNDRMIAGVCGGLAEYFDVDSSLIRLAVLFIFLFQGIGLFAYIIAWLVMSEEPDQNRYRMPDDYYLENKDEKNKKDDSESDSTSESERNNENRDYQKYKEESSSNNKRRKLFAVLLIIIGSIFLLDIWIPALYWEKYWPLILIFGGFLLLKGDNSDR